MSSDYPGSCYKVTREYNNRFDTILKHTPGFTFLVTTRRALSVRDKDALGVLRLWHVH